MNLKKTISCILCAAVATSLSLSAAPANEKDSAKAAKGVAGKPTKSGAKEAKGAGASKTGDKKMMSKPEAKGSKGNYFDDFVDKASKGRNGFFAGGGLFLAMAPSAVLPSTTSISSSGFGVGVEATGGYQYYFDGVLEGKLGVRGFGRVEYSIMGFSGTSGVTGAFGLLFGGDVIYDVAKLEKMMVSVYTGMYLGFHAWHGGAMKPAPAGTLPSYSSGNPDTVYFSMGSSLGTLLELSKSSTVDIYVRFPWFSHSSSKTVLAIYGPLSLGASYIYKF